MTPVSSTPSTSLHDTQAHASQMSRPQVNPPPLIDWSRDSLSAGSLCSVDTPQVLTMLRAILDDNHPQSALIDFLIQQLSISDAPNQPLIDGLRLRVLAEIQGMPPIFYSQLQEATRSSSPWRTALQECLAHDVRKGLAGNPSVSSELLHSMAGLDNSLYVRALVATNPSTSADTLKWMAEHESDPSILYHIARRSVTEQPVVLDLIAQRMPTMAFTMNVLKYSK